MSKSDEQLHFFSKCLLPSWLPNETLFSLISRHHYLSCNALARTTCQQVFGHPQRGSAHDFPSRIDEFVRRTNAALGDAETIVRHHTILPFYFPFRTPADVANALAAVRGPSIGSLKFALGLLTSRFRAHHPLKACSACMIDDRKNGLVAYWRRDHQLPGVWVCPKHGLCLLESTVKSTGVERFGWELPIEQNLRDPASLGKSPVLSAIPIFGRLAELAIRSVHLPKGFHFEAQALLEIYQEALSRRGLVRGENGQKNMNAIGAAYLAHVAPLRSLPEFAALPGTVGEARMQVAKLLTLPRSGTHPLRHLILIDWLFESWPAFWSVYHLMRGPQAAPVMEPTLPSCPVFYRKDQAEILVSLLGDQKMTVSAAAKQLRIDPATAMAWAAAAGIASKRRSKVLKPDRLERMIAFLRQGHDKCAVACEIGVSISTVTRILRTEVGLQSRWHQIRHDTALKTARGKWLDVKEMNPHAPIKFHRLLESATFAWLYRNDRAWLDEQSITTLRQKHQGNNANLDWCQRDVALAEEVERIALEISQARVGAPITLWQIYQRLPDLKAKLNQLNKLPLTSAILTRVVGRRRSRCDKNQIDY